MDGGAVLWPARALSHMLKYRRIWRNTGKAYLHMYLSNMALL